MAKRFLTTLTGLLGFCFLAPLASLQELPLAYATPPVPLVKAVRIQHLEAATQVVLDLTGIPKDLKVQDNAGTPMTIAFTGRLNPHLQASSQQLPLGKITFRQQGNQVRVTVQRQTASPVSVYPVRNPSRLVLSALKKTTRTLAAAGRVVSTTVGRKTTIPAGTLLAPGVKHRQMTQKTAAGPVQVNLLEVDPQQPGIEIRPALARPQMAGKARVSTIVAQENAIAGINGSFFKQDTGIPLGTLIINQELISGPIYDRVALGLTHDNQLRMARVTLGGSVTLFTGATEESIFINTVNQPRVATDQTVLYSSRWGKVAPPMPKNGVQAQIVGQRITALSTTTPLPIPAEGYVLSGPRHAALQTWLQNPSQPLPAVTVNLYTLPDWSDVKHAIGGGPYLVKDGGVYVDTAAQRVNLNPRERSPRSAAGITRGGKLLLVTVDGRQSASAGMTLGEMARLMYNLGCVQAMNLDGGSSTQMVVAGRLVNHPSAGQGVAVNNGLVIRHVPEAVITTAPAGEALPRTEL